MVNFDQFFFVPALMKTYDIYLITQKLWPKFCFCGQTNGQTNKRTGQKLLAPDLSMQGGHKNQFTLMQSSKSISWFTLISLLMIRKASTLDVSSPVLHTVIAFYYNRLIDRISSAIKATSSIHGSLEFLSRKLSKTLFPVYPMLSHLTIIKSRVNGERETDLVTMTIIKF